MDYVFVILFFLLDIVLAIFGYEREREPANPEVKRRHPVAAYFIGLAVALLILAGLFGLCFVLMQVTYLVALAIVSILLAGLFGLMLVLVRLHIVRVRQAKQRPSPNKNDEQ